KTGKLALRPDQSHGGTSKSEGFYTWSEADIATFEDRYPIGSRARLALALLLYTCQRRSDVVRMGRQHVRNGALAVRQQKTGTSLEIPLHPDLQSVLEASQAEHLTFLVTHEGRPFTPAGFTNWFRDTVRAAGLPDGCSPHGLRKAACRRLAEAGCTPHEIMSISGHKSLKEVTRYTAAAEQKRLAVRAMSTVVGMEREQPLANAAKKLATSTSNPLT
ncbi:tyrosine-type recombinase/integrase, partial [Methylobacterium durans]|uniref:tyrosine-type recombinase/integrase n=1 Tax=Methylobacterium durans TaxID=2202825 RepID=UPI002AFF0D76